MQGTPIAELLRPGRPSLGVFSSPAPVVFPSPAAAVARDLLEESRRGRGLELLKEVPLFPLHLKGGGGWGG